MTHFPYSVSFQCSFQFIVSFNWRTSLLNSLLTVLGDVCSTELQFSFICDFIKNRPLVILLLRKRSLNEFKLILSRVDLQWLSVGVCRRMRFKIWICVSLFIWQ